MPSSKIKYDPEYDDFELDEDELNKFYIPIEEEIRMEQEEEMWREVFEDMEQAHKEGQYPNYENFLKEMCNKMDSK